MPDECVLDSSIIAAIFFREIATKKAIKLVQNKNLLTVDLAVVEVANVAWKRVIFFSEDEVVIEEALKNSVEFINTSCEVIKMDELIDLSFKIAVEEKITVYDSLFLAAARREEIPLYTLDKKLGTRDGVELLS